MDSYWLNVTNQQLGNGLFSVVNDMGGEFPPPPIDSGYRITTTGVTRALTDGNYRVTAT
jgi:hypothetical protein